jgi:hypothetical protein
VERGCIPVWTANSNLERGRWLPETEQRLAWNFLFSFPSIVLDKGSLEAKKQQHHLLRVAPEYPLLFQDEDKERFPTEA